MSELPSASRRDFLKGAGLFGAASVLGSQSANAVSPPKPEQLGRAKNLIFLVADGMGTGTLSLANHWKLRNTGEPLQWMQLYNRPGFQCSLQDTASANSPVTDSAAAGSAWGCGQRVNNRSINTDPNGQSLTPLYTLAKQAGKATGLVTTCRVTHATPAAFAANVPHRDLEDQIAQQYLEREIDLILGGGSFHFDRDAVPHTMPEKALPAVDLLPYYRAQGYTICRTLSELQNEAHASRLLGIFSKSHIPYAIDRKYDTALAEVPSLPQMFEAALGNLSSHSDGFVLQVEGGRVDHAGHANDPAAILHEQLDFDACIPLALKFIESNPDTLLIVTTDHGTGGCELNGIGGGYLDSGPALERINSITASFEALQARFEALGHFDAGLWKRATGLSADLDQAAVIQTAIDTKVKYISSVLANTFADQLFNKTAVGWTSHNHTSEHVELLAAGPGSEQIPRLIQNNQLFNYVTQALGLSA